MPLFSFCIPFSLKAREVLHIRTARQWEKDCSNMLGMWKVPRLPSPAKDHQVTGDVKGHSSLMTAWRATARATDLNESIL